MKTLALVAVALLLVGCGTVSPPPSTVQVQVPVPYPVYCTPPDVPFPSLPIDALPATADPFETLRAWIASFELLEGHAAQLQVAVDACRTPQ